LIKQESYLLDLVRSGARTLDQLKADLALDKIHEAPDDIAIMTVTKEA